jgi:hypothetical protein
MRKLHIAAATAAATLIAGTLAGCSGVSQSLPLVGGPQSAAAQPPLRAQSSKRVKSWISPDAKSASQLLYVADDFGPSGSVVNVYAWPSLTQFGVMTGFQDVEGLCTDKKGDVYVLDSESNRVTEYPHGGLVPIVSLSAANAEGCSVDPKTGNLAVTTLIGTSGGNVSIFSHGRGTPKSYTGADLYEYSFPAYDDAGDLFVDGFPIQGGVILAELPSGGSALEAISMNQTVEEPGGLQWDGKYLAIGDQYQNVIYQLAISGTSATSVGSTSLGGADYIFDFAVTGIAKGQQGNGVVAGSFGNGSVFGWSYPGGGQPAQSLSGLSYPEGVAISGK